MANIAYVDWSLWVECPNCKEDINLNDERYDIDGEISKPIFNNDWSKLIGFEVACPGCDCEFKLDGVEH